MQLRERMTERLVFVLLLLLILGAAVGETYAAEIETEFNAGIGNTDNVARTAVNTIEETISQIGVRFELSENTRKIDAKVKSNFNYFNYLDNTFEDEVFGGLDGRVNISIVEERLKWLIQENNGNQLFDPFAPDRPENRENVNFFTTGPSLSLPVGSRVVIGADLQFSIVSYEDRPLDNHRSNATIWLGREIREGVMYSLNVSGTRIDYENDVIRDYDRLETYLRFASDEGRNVFNVDVGFTNLDIDPISDDGFLLRADWTRQLTPFSSLKISAGTQFSDQSDQFRAAQDAQQDIGGTLDINVTGSPSRLNWFRTGYDITRNRTRLGFRAGFFEQDFQQRADFDRTELRINFFVERDLSRRAFVRLALGIYQRDYNDRAREDDDISAELTLGYQITDGFRAHLEYRYYDRESDQDISDYIENRAFLNIYYTPKWGRR